MNVSAEPLTPDVFVQGARDRFKALRSAARITAQSIVPAPVINSGIYTTQESETRHTRSQLF